MGKTLYVSDLDGTLLNKQGNLTRFSREKLNELLQRGLLFTVASARSIKSIKAIMEGVDITLPVIEFNGAYITDFSSGEHLFINDISHEIKGRIMEEINSFSQEPLLSTYNGEKNRLYYTQINNAGVEWYIEGRKAAGDDRLACVASLKDCLGERVVCFTIINRLEKVIPLKEKLGQKFGSQVELNLMENEYFPGWHWLTVHDRKARKDRAISELLQQISAKVEKVTVFGDNVNDLPMFEKADRSIAVENARPELKKRASQVIGANHRDSVAKFLLKDFAQH